MWWSSEIPNTKQSHYNDPNAYTIFLFNRFNKKKLAPYLDIDKSEALCDFNELSQLRYEASDEFYSSQHRYEKHLESMERKLPFLNFDVIYDYLEMDGFVFYLQSGDIDFFKKIINYPALEKLNELEE